MRRAPAAASCALALRAGFDPARIHCTATPSPRPSCARRSTRASGTIVLDNARRARPARAARAARAPPARACCASRPASAPTRTRRSPRAGRTRSSASTSTRRAARSRASQASDRLDLDGLHIHIGSQILDLAPFRAALEALAALGDFDVYNLGGGLGVAYTRRATGRRRSRTTSRAKVDARRASCSAPGTRDRSTSRAARWWPTRCVTLYTVQSVKRNVATWVAVDGGMSDNLRPMLYGARYEARSPTARRRHDPATSPASTASPATSSSATPTCADPRPGDVIVTPATGAYGYAMANNYNGDPAAAGGLRHGRRRAASSCAARPTTDLLRDARCLRPRRSASACSATARSAARSPRCSRERADADRARSPACGREVTGVLTPQPRRLRARSSPRCDLVVEVMGGLEPARELRAARDGGRQATSSPPTSSCSASTARSCGRPRASTACSCASRPPSPASCPSSACCRSRWPPPTSSASTGSSTGRRTSSSREMAATGASYADALAEAQRLGYAEADPTDDVNGRDAAAKMAILARLAFDTPVHLDQVRYEGIEHLTADDMAYARELGLGLKLIGTAERVDGGAGQRARASGVPLRRPPAGQRQRPVQRGDDRVARRSPRSRCRGPGAGGPQTASAVLGDVISAMIPPASTPAATRARWRSSTTSSRPSTCTSRSPTGPACWRRSPSCSGCRARRSSPSSRRGWGRTRGW